MRYLILILIFASCNTLKVTEVRPTTNGGCINYFYYKKIENWMTIVDDTLGRFEEGDKISLKKFYELEK